MPCYTPCSTTLESKPMKPEQNNQKITHQKISIRRNPSYDSGTQKKTKDKRYNLGLTDKPQVLKQSQQKLEKNSLLFAPNIAQHLMVILRNRRFLITRRSIRGQEKICQRRTSRQSLYS